VKKKETVERSVTVPYAEFHVEAVTVQQQPGIRITHIPTGCTTRAYVEADAAANAKLAMERLRRNSKFKTYLRKLVKENS